MQASKQEAELSERPLSSETSAAVHAEQRGGSASAVMANAETQKGPRRRNRAERAALHQEQDLLEQQQARRKQRYVVDMPNAIVDAWMLYCIIVIIMVPDSFSIH